MYRIIPRKKQATTMFLQQDTLALNGENNTNPPHTGLG